LTKASRHKEGEDSKSVNACIDALIWVGSSSKKTETVDEFLKEAQLRGCCRRLPFIPSWAEFGKTKVFLAHRDIHEVPSRGSIFGYFVLHRIEIITENEVAQSLSKIQDKTPWPRNIKDYATRIKKWKKKGYSEQNIKRRLEKRLQTKYIIDFAKGETSEELDPELPEDLKELIEQFKEFIKDVIRKIFQKLLEIDNNGKIGNIGCFPPNNSTEGEGHRMCSIRKGPGSVYAVDALCATIHDTYQQKLQKRLEVKKSGEREAVLEEIKQDNQDSWEEWVEYKRNHEWTVQELLEMYRGPFHDAVETHFDSDRQPKYPIDPRLKGKASNYGDLIVFKKPFPILERKPRAAFRGVCHIDGDKLIDQIVKHSEEGFVPTIYYCKAKPAPSRPRKQIATKDEVITLLAQELHVSKTRAKHLLDKSWLKRRVNNFKSLKLQGIGTIRLKGKKGHKKIKFYPAKTIRSIKPKKK
jgi:nucleoid DNA-binding protein